MYEDARVGWAWLAARQPDPSRRYPSRTPKYFLPNSNIWIWAEGGEPRRVSYLSGAEFAALTNALPEA